MPRSTSLTVTLAFAKIAPVWSLTVPTMLPASFCAHIGIEEAAQTTARKRTESRKLARFGMAILLGTVHSSSAAGIQRSARMPSGEMLRTLTFTFVLCWLSSQKSGFHPVKTRIDRLQSFAASSANWSQGYPGGDGAGWRGKTQSDRKGKQSKG